jgi:hypothetical protein
MIWREGNPRGHELGFQSRGPVEEEEIAQTIFCRDGDWEKAVHMIGRSVFVGLRSESKRRLSIGCFLSGRRWNTRSLKLVLKNFEVQA